MAKQNNRNCVQHNTHTQVYKAAILDRTVVEIIFEPIFCLIETIKIMHN